MSNIVLYTVSDGPPSLAVKMAFAALKVDYKNVEVDFGAGEHMTDDFAKVT